MWAIEEAIAICETEDDASRDTSWIEPDLRDTFEQVNGLYKKNNHKLSGEPKCPDQMQ